MGQFFLSVDTAGVKGDKTAEHKHRLQDTSIEFLLVNIGAERAENVKLNLSGTLRRNRPREDFGSLSDREIPQLAPGQTMMLFRFDQFDLLRYEDGESKPAGIKDEHLTITMEYNGAPGWLNSLLSLPWSIQGMKRYRSEFSFDPSMAEGDLPSPEYA